MKAVEAVKPSDAMDETLQYFTSFLLCAMNCSYKASPQHVKKEVFAVPGGY